MMKSRVKIAIAQCTLQRLHRHRPPTSNNNTLTNQTQVVNNHNSPLLMSPMIAVVASVMKEVQVIPIANESTLPVQSVAKHTRPALVEDPVIDVPKWDYMTDVSALFAKSES